MVKLLQKHQYEKNYFNSVRGRSPPSPLPYGSATAIQLLLKNYCFISQLLFKQHYLHFSLGEVRGRCPEEMS